MLCVAALRYFVLRCVALPGFVLHGGFQLTRSDLVQSASYEHYLKVVGSTFNFAGGRTVDTYTYTTNSHQVRRGGGLGCCWGCGRGSCSLWGLLECLLRFAQRVDVVVEVRPTHQSDVLHPQYVEDGIASAKFTYDLSPMSIVVSETRPPFYKFITSVCAIIGGVFTVIGLLDSMVYHGLRSFERKVQLGKTN